MFKSRIHTMLLAALIMAAPTLASSAKAQTSFEYQINAIYMYGMTLVSGTTVTVEKEPNRRVAKKKVTKKKVAKKKVTEKKVTAKKL